MIIGELLPRDVKVPFDICNQEMTKKNISKMIDAVYRHCGQKETVIFCRPHHGARLRSCLQGRHFVRQGRHGRPDTKTKIVDGDRQDRPEYEQQYNDGLITQGEKYNKVSMPGRSARQAAEEMMERIQAVETEENGRQKPMNSIYMMATPARAVRRRQMKQLAGMRGLMAKPSARSSRRRSSRTSRKA
jgi:DNA-directed RNA polymerase subunit beta'